MHTIIHRAEERGHAEHGWLHSWHSFSFARYYDPTKLGFGKLRVLNDDLVEAGAGFGTHSHENMEIISIPLSGALRHQDSMGNTHIIGQGDVQIMSAGTGLTHSEYNNSSTDQVNFLQIWVYPKVQDIQPRYDQKTFDRIKRLNTIQTIVSPENDESVWINQDAYFSLCDLDTGKSIEYVTHNAVNGIYIFVIRGSISVAEEQLNARDAIGITGSDNIEIKSLQSSELLFIEVPVNY